MIGFERLNRPLLPLWFTVFATTGGMGKEASVFYRRLAIYLLSHKNNVTYDVMLAWLRWTLSFSLQLQCAFVVLAGSSHIDLQMFPLSWAWLLVSGSTKFTCSFKQLSST